MTRPWYRRFPDNFIGGTLSLTLEEKGAYSLVLDLMYLRDGPVEDEPRYISGVCNCSVRKWNAIRGRLIDLGKLYVIEGRLYNERAEKEIENALKDAQERAENGAKGGNKTAENKTNTNKFNGPRPASVQPTRATLNQNQLKKEGNLVLVGKEETITLDRVADYKLFETCETIQGEKVKDFLHRFPFPKAIVSAAVETLRSGAAA